jgi:hypothetical protein
LAFGPKIKKEKKESAWLPATLGTLALAKQENRGEPYKYAEMTREPYDSQELHRSLGDGYWVAFDYDS